MDKRQEWRSRRLARTRAEARAMILALLCEVMSLTAIGFMFFAASTRGSFLTQWWDYPVVFLAVAGYIGARVFDSREMRHRARGIQASAVPGPSVPEGRDQTRSGTGTVWRRRVMSRVGIVAIPGIVLLAVWGGNSLKHGANSQVWILFGTAIALLLIALFGIARVLIERGKGLELISSLEFMHPGATFGIWRFAALREQLVEVRGDVSRWDWMVLAAVTTGDDGITVWGGRAKDPKKVVVLPWERIRKVEQADVRVRFRDVRGIWVTVEPAGTPQVSIELAPVSFQTGRFRPVGDGEFQKLLAQMRQPSSTP